MLYHPQKHGGDKPHVVPVDVVDERFTNFLAKLVYHQDESKRLTLELCFPKAIGVQGMVLSLIEQHNSLVPKYSALIEALVLETNVPPSAH